ncbi:MAG TPA: hypothetical protein VFD37_05220, partial [Solirubrobacterales bacterium]|nr:hypothetical protein [Solirubrobacterales bacterium]
RLVLSKLVVYLGAGVAFGLASVLVAVGLSAAIFSLRGIDGGLTAEILLRDGAGNVAAIALWAALGVGVGAIIRNQVGALVGALAYVFVVESLLPIVPQAGDAVQKYGLNGLTLGLAPSDSFGDAEVELLAQIPAGLLLSAYAALLIAAGIFLMRRRDIAE